MSTTPLQEKNHKSPAVSRGEIILLAATGTAVSFLALYLLLCLFMALWLALQVPLAPQDLKWASWTGSILIPVHWFGHVGLMLAAMATVSGISAGLMRHSLIPPLASLVMAGTLCAASSEATLVRVGVWEGAIKLGCYVETSECLKMLDLPPEGAPSRYARQTDGGYADAPWYRAAREKAHIDEDRASTYSVPVALFLRLPFLLGHTDDLKARLAGQRLAVEQYRAAKLQAQANLTLDAVTAK